MKVVSISKNKFENLERCIFNDVNTEGELYKFTYHGELKLFKKLYFYEGNPLAKKLFTVEVLNSHELPSCFVVPDSLISVNNKIVGFSIPYISGITLRNMLDNQNFPIDIKLKYLKDIGNILEKMVKIRKHTELKHFYLNDVHESNFMINYDTGELCVIDLDGCKINPTFSFPSRYLTIKALLNNTNKYNIDNFNHGVYVMANFDSDLYCYIIIILNFLYGECINNIDISDYYEYLNYLESIGINKELIGAFNRIVTYGDNINPMEYLDSLTDTQICRAKKKVYDIVRK